MKQYLLDTNICIFLLRGNYDVDKKIDNVGLNHCAISEITEAELRYGAELGKAKGMKRRNQDLEAFFHSICILPITNCLKLFAQEKVM
jgi:tRNA(fMet)-specific endonuclease VapC